MRKEGGGSREREHARILHIFHFSFRFIFYFIPQGDNIVWFARDTLRLCLLSWDLGIMSNSLLLTFRSVLIFSINFGSHPLALHPSRRPGSMDSDSLASSQVGPGGALVGG